VTKGRGTPFLNALHALTWVHPFLVIVMFLRSSFSMTFHTTLFIVTLVANR